MHVTIPDGMCFGDDTNTRLKDLLPWIFCIFHVICNKARVLCVSDSLNEAGDDRRQLVRPSVEELKLQG